MRVCNHKQVQFYINTKRMSAAKNRLEVRRIPLEHVAVLEYRRSREAKLAFADADRPMHTFRRNLHC